MNREDFIEKSNKFRGDIIGQTSSMDFIINMLIGHAISKNHVNLMLSILSNLNFDYKISILETLMNNEWKKKIPNLSQELRNMQQLRNSFAHSINHVDMVDDYDKLDKFILIKAGKPKDKNLTKTEYYLKDHEANLKKLKELSGILIEMSGLHE